MTRAERRREKTKQDKAAVYNYTEDQLKDAVNIRINSKMNMIINSSVENCLSVTIKVLNEGFGLGTTRLLRFMEEYNAMFDKILSDELDLETVREEAMKYGIKLNSSRAEGE
jgi:hypothetical protein